MIFSAGEKVTFPQTPGGRERARTFAAANPGRAAVDPRRLHVVILSADFELRAVGVQSAKITRMPSCRETLGRIGQLCLPFLLFFMIGGFVSAAGLGDPSPLALSPVEMILGRIGDGAAVATTGAESGLPDPKSHESIGWMITTGAAVLVAIGALLAFLRKESRMQEPEMKQHVHGGPVQITMSAEYASKADHEAHKTEIWTVINGLRMAISEIKEDVAGIRALREANGERMAELGHEVTELTKAVARLTGVVETKLQKKT